MVWRVNTMRRGRKDGRERGTTLLLCERFNMTLDYKESRPQRFMLEQEERLARLWRKKTTGSDCMPFTYTKPETNFIVLALQT